MIDVKYLGLGVVGVLAASAAYVAIAATGPVGDDVIEGQRAALSSASDGLGFGPQSPRDLESPEGTNGRTFSIAPPAAEMTLCDIHFHENAEHRGGEFTTYAGNGDGKGYGTGFKYDGELTDAELADLDAPVGVGEHGDLAPGDTIEIHFVHSTAKATLGNGLGTCLSEATGNPQLRVETVVAVLVNDASAADFVEMAAIQEIDGLNQVPNLPTDLGEPIVYAGSTTGPSYNEVASPFQVTWSIRPRVAKVDINSLATWLSDNPFEEDHAHGVRNLVMDPNLLSPIR